MCSRTYLPDLFPGMDVLERSVFRVTRDADLEVSDEADDLLEAVELELRRARFGEVTRLEVSESMSQAMRERLQQGLRVADELVYPLDGILDLADLAELSKLDRPDLKNEPWLPVARPPWNSIESASEQFAAIRAGDLARPPSVRLVRQRASSRTSTAPRPTRGGDRDQVDGVPDERRHAARARA